MNIFKVFHLTPMCDGRMKLYSNGPGTMTKMATMPVYGKGVLKVFSELS